MQAQISASRSRPDDCPDGGRRPRLARPLEIERSCGDAPNPQSDRLDRFESAVAFAIQEATRLRHEPESGPTVVSQHEVSAR
jgi:hypothetical protein